MTEYHFIVNRESSGGACLRRWEEAERILKEQQVSYIVHFPKDEEETVCTVKELTAAGRPECNLVVIGGDGTLNAVLRGIVCFEKTRFSCLTGGSANDFARDMDLSHDTEEALDAILHTPRECLLDYGELACRKEGSRELFRSRFLISSGIGYDAHICAIAAKSPLKRLFGRLGLGSLIYVSIGVFLMLTGRYGKARIRIDDGETFEIPHFIFVAMIHKYEGGGIAFCPDSDPTDGWLDLCIVKQMPRFRKLRAFLLVLKEKHGQVPEVSILRCKSAHVRTSHPEWFHMDGETPFRTNEIRYTVENGLRFIS